MPANLFELLHEVRRTVLISKPQLENGLRIHNQQLKRIIHTPGTTDLLDDVSIGGETYYRLAPNCGLLVGVDLQQDQGQLTVREMDFSPTTEQSSVALGPLSTATPIGTVLDDLADQICTSLQHCPKRDLVGVGLALPAPVDRDSGQAAVHFIVPGWESYDIAAELQRRLAARRIDTRVIVGNDGSLGALGAFSRAKIQDPANSPDDLVYVRLASGIGSGIVLKGHLVTGSSGFAGEIGHLKMRDTGPLCPRCGGRGCLEVIAGNDAVHQDIAAATAAAGLSFEAALAVSHPATTQALWNAGWSVGTALAHICTLINPKWIVLDGSMSLSSPFCEAVRHAIARNALPQCADAEVITWTDLRAEWKASQPEHIGWSPEQELTPELFGALALVVDTFADDLLHKRADELANAAPAAPARRK